MMASDDNLEQAVEAVEKAHALCRTLSAAHPGDMLYYEAENRCAAVALSLIGRLNNTRLAPPTNRVDIAFHA
jgi:hypothetical protein